MNTLIWQCVDVTPGETITVAASTYLASGQGATGYGWVWGGFIDGPSCSGSTIQTVYKQGNSTLLDTWERLEVQSIAPTGAQSLRLNLYCSNNSTSVDFKCRADNVYVPEPSRWLLALSALGTLTALTALRETT